MNNSKEKSGAIAGLMVVIITQAFMRFIGVSEMSTIICVTILSIVAVAYPIVIFKRKNDKFGKELCIISSVVMVTACVLNSITLLFIEVDLNNKHRVIGMILAILSIVSFLAVIIFWIVAAGIISNKN